MRKTLTIFILLTISLTHCSSENIIKEKGKIDEEITVPNSKPYPKEQSQIEIDFANVLDIARFPNSYKDYRAFGFSDQGAWHAYSLPAKKDNIYYGGFGGPMLMEMEGEWASKSISRLFITDINTGENINLSKANANINYYPGKLSQRLSIGDLVIDMELIFVNNRTSLIKTELTNNGSTDLNYKVGFKGKLINSKLKISKDNSNVIVKIGRRILSIKNSFAEPLIEISLDGKSYTAIEANTITIKQNETKVFTTTHTYCFSNDELEKQNSKIEDIHKSYKNLFTENTKRWTNYITKALNSENALLKDEQNKRAKVKTIETLISNWRSAAGDLKHDGVFPSAGYSGFYGFWSWDSWKQAYALVNFAPELAKSNILSMFDFQNDRGMIADCVYFNDSDNNWRDTKAPLAAWAVWEIYKKTKDLEFVRTMYPKLVKYHRWWYQYRDSNKNGLCEYGSTDGSLIAAKWESGMDNAIRFDNTRMIKNSDNDEWTMNQESVDLNSYLYAEKLFLANMSRELGNGYESNFTNEAEILKEEIRTKFWDEKTGFFYDRYIYSGKVILSQQGPEGWIPLWAKIATKQQAEKVLKVIMNTKKFNTKLPFPTISAEHNKFDPYDGYWRGPVWIDQAYFGIIALENYSFNSEAKILTKQLIENAEGFLGDAPIRENYHPLTGEGLNANHFSWSAAHYYLLLN